MVFALPGGVIAGITPQGITPQGITPQGITPQGITPQGITPQGVVLMGTDLLSSEGQGVSIKSIEMRGTTSTSASAKTTTVLTNIPDMSSGPGNYITVDGHPALGHYALAHLADAAGNLVSSSEDLDLFIADEKPDPMSNLFHNADEQVNQDEVYLVYFFHKWSGQWMSLCPYDVNTKMASAMAIPEDRTQPNEFYFACTATGVASKCVRNWGYKPWATASVWQFSGGSWALTPNVDLKPYYDSCVFSARAGYCQDSKSYTKAGTLVDSFDISQIIWPNSIENPFSSSNPDSQWMMAQEYFIATCTDPTDPNCFNPNNSSMKASALQRSRYKELSPSADCDNFAFVDRLEHDHIEDGRWATPVPGISRIQVFSGTHCTHDEYTVKDDEPLPWDCTPCTTKVCQTSPECCGAGPSPGWTAACVAQATAECQTGGTQWPKGRVWPAGVDTSGTKVLPKYLFGSQGAVLRVEGTSGEGTSVTVSGWACDPEWPDATVAVAIYGAPKDTVLEPLAIVQADQALALPLAREVSAACDGPGRAYARHGFSYTLPANQSGNVFVYAMDRETDDSKPAPDTLVRNGIIHVPRCAHSEHEVGAQLDDECSDCATQVCESDSTCCSSSWTAACAQLADACTPTNSSAPLNSRIYTAVTTGWVEAPADGTYTFDSSIQPSRLFINGTPVLDWFENALGSKQGSIDLRAGQKYHVRWDRLQTAPPSGSGPGLTWQPPGAVGQVAIPSGNLYGIAPGGGTGLQARYVDGDSSAGPQVDPQVDINKDVQPPAPTPKQDLPTGITPPYAALWNGEVIPTVSGDYTFYVVGDGNALLAIDGTPVSAITTAANTAPGGCGHDLCELGDKLDASCNWCVQKVCDKDDYCCNGGYLSYYSFDFVWDAKCVSEVNAYCGAGACSTPPLASPGPKQVKFGPKTLQAGVRYQIRLLHISNATDKTIRLLWSSDRLAKQVIPQFSLFPANPPAAGLGAGLNVTYFGTTTANNVVSPNLSDVVASGFVSDFSLTPTIGQTGTPLIDVLAAPSATAQATPPPPTVVRPRFDELESFAAPQVEVIGVGGLPGGTVRIGLDSDPTVEVIASVASDGKWTATVGTGATFGPQTIKLIQRAPGATCVIPTDGACSYEITIPVNTVEATDPGKAPTITSPTDPTHSPAAVATVFAVKGHGTTADVHIVDQGSFPDTFTNIKPASDGTFDGSITLSPGTTAEPMRGWHKLLFDQGGLVSHPVFASVGINPPTVEFPRNGAELSCDDSDQTEPPEALGTLAYPESAIGPLNVFEETGRDVLGDVAARIVPLPPLQTGGLPRFRVFFGDLSVGKHLLLFFQAPVQPSPGTTLDEHRRAFSSLADTPFSRILVERRPTRMQIAQRAPVIITPVPGQILPQVALGAVDCPGQASCAAGGADVNIRVGDRVYTTRAAPNGTWNLTAPLPVGWSAVNVSQVVDSKVGGAWSESCPTLLNYGVQDFGGPTITVPDSPAPVEATSAAGAQVFYGDATAKTAAGVPVPVTCLPTSGSTFRIGVTPVLCTATDNSDPAHPKVGLDRFFVTVFDAPPNVQVSDVELEADQPAGAELATYPILVSDVVDPSPMVVCIPPPPNLFLIDEVTPVTCDVTDSGRNTVTASFTVKVRDRTPPTLCPLSDILIGTNAGAGAFVTFATCADDIVDGTVPVKCDHDSGSFFPFGTTTVTCEAKDTRGNKATDSFDVSVGDTIPPVLKLPDVVTAFATSKLGARVNYTVTATDNVDPNPTVKCKPPSGSQFPIGSSTVTCTATDASGNTSQGTFKVRVLVKWSGLLPPIPSDGTGVFNRGST
ncbi:MAG TPA: HYR domain-containing protein, partial [Polyangia bacterium]|nr:HYR domain-containing protein [Polyangia bacterium]